MTGELRHPTRIRVGAVVKAVVAVGCAAMATALSATGVVRLLEGETVAALLLWLFSVPTGLLAWSGSIGLTAAFAKVQADAEGLTLTHPGRTLRLTWDHIAALEHRPGLTLAPPRLSFVATDGRRFTILKRLPGYGEIVWRLRISTPYEAERLGTGDESTGGMSAAALDLPSQTPNSENRSTAGDVAAWAPQSIVNGIAYLLPGWVGPVELLAALGLVVVVPVWSIVEWRRRTFDVSVRWPVQFRDR
jgi:hypothetical protein